MLEAIFVLEIFTFMSCLFFVFFGYKEKRLDKKAIVKILKFRISQTGQQILTKYILPNISRSKDNQTMNFGQIIE